MSSEHESEKHPLTPEERMARLIDFIQSQASGINHEIAETEKWPYLRTDGRVIRQEQELQALVRMRERVRAILEYADSLQPYPQEPGQKAQGEN